MTASAQVIGCRRAGRPPGEASVLAAVVVALMAIGVLVVYSASRTVDPSEDGYYFTRHLMFLPVALAAMVLAAWLPWRWLNSRWVALAAMVVAVGALVPLFILSFTTASPMRWYRFGVGGLRFSLQPSEFAKVALVIFLAWYYGRERTDPRRFGRGFLLPMVVIGFVCILIAKEDFGTAALIGAVATLVCLIAGCRLWYFFTMIPPAAFGFWLFVYRVPYRWDRIVAFLDPWAHQDGAGWHIVQSLMAIGRGGWFGVGLGAGIQKFYLPQCANDFIFAVLVEEMGILGGILVLGLFGALVWRGGRIIRNAPERFAFLLASGLLLMIGLQAVMNIGVVTGALPAKGIGLPFISYGGSGLVVMSLAVGLLGSIARGGRSRDLPPDHLRRSVYRRVAGVRQ
ncbi:MAG TPA: putative peptidoglycan glycosyltransferase FtsW [Phycisphaerae bacterium]|nr:putative peptidoglycan glycosyltransferase FtsW [Phycisphaerae bacterium]